VTHTTIKIIPYPLDMSNEYGDRHIISVVERPLARDHHYRFLRLMLPIL
jgi:hypothetical protein